MTEQAVKLNRTDVARLIALQVQDQLERDVVASIEAVQQQREAFERVATTAAHSLYRDLLRHATDAYGLLVGKVHYECTVDQPGGDCVQVTFSDSERGYDGRCFFTCNVPMDEEMTIARDAWHSALKVEAICRARDARMSALQKDARDEIIKAALAAEGGKELLAAAKKVAAVVVVEAERLAKSKEPK